MSYRTGTQHPNAKLDWDAVRDIRSSDETLIVLAKRYGVSVPTIHSVRHGITWREVA